MKDTDLVIHTPKKNNIFWQAYYKLYSKEKPKPDINIDIIDVKVLPPRGLALWKLIAASWVLRLGRCYEDAEFGIILVLAIGLLGGAMMGIGFYMDMDVRHTAPSLLVGFFGAFRLAIECAVCGLTVVYSLWELVQGCKWLTKWSEKIKLKAREEAYQNEQRRHASSHD